jgi:hypothetical protein
MATALPIRAGDTVYLTPRSLAASWDVHCQPRVSVISGPANGTFLVLLPDGRQIRVAESDVVRKLPNPPRERAPRPRKALPGAEELELW